MAVVIVLGLGIITAWGTLVEADYNAEIAAKTVYHSIWMYTFLGLLCVSLTAVMVDRWPWKKRHAPFVLAHIGILVLMFGSVLTRYTGIDGSMVFGIGETSKFVIVAEPEFTIYSSIDAQSYTRLYSSARDFYKNPPPPEGIEIPISGASFKVLDYIPFALRDQKVVQSENKGDAPAVRFQLQNANVNMTEWILGTGKMRDAIKDLGPAKIILTSGSYQSPGGENAIVLTPAQDGQSLHYEILTRRDPASAPEVKTRATTGKKTAGQRKGTVRAGDVIETPWMGLVMRVLNYWPHAKEQVTFHKRERPTEMTSPALKVKFNQTEQWVALDSLVKFYSDEAVYVVSFANRRIDLSQVFKDPEFNIKLQKFEVGRYQGTMRAASYQSVVSVPGRQDVVISMNEPLKHNGFTFYQASFQEDEAGRPTASILSVNRDPGRFWKYLGSLLIVLGSTLLFYNKKMAGKKAAGGATA